MRNRGLYLSSLASLFARLLLDRKYDELANHPDIRAIREGHPATRAGIVTIINAIGAYVDTYLPTDTPLRKFTMGLAVDAGTEVSARMVNQPYARASDIWRIAELDESQLEQFLDVWEQASVRERQAMRDFIKRHTASQVGKFLGLSPRNRTRLMTYATERRDIIPRRIASIDAMVERMRRPLFSLGVVLCILLLI